MQESRRADFAGGVRMSQTSGRGVCDKFGRIREVHNPLVMDGSAIPAQSSANAGLTIQALATRTADFLIRQMQSSPAAVAI